MGRKNLADLQEQLRRKNAMADELSNATQNPVIMDNEKYCVNCVTLIKEGLTDRKKPRVCRKGSSLCSRCTMKGVENQLRDTLPGMKFEEAEQIVKNTNSMLEQRKDDLIVPEFASEEEKQTWWQEHHDKVEEEFRRKVSLVEEHLDVNPPGLEFGTEVQYSTPQPGTRFYTRREVSEKLGIPDKKIGRWEQKGYVPRMRQNNKPIYTDELIEEIRKYAEKTAEVRFTPAVPMSPQQVAAKSIGKSTFNSSKAVNKAVARNLAKSGFRPGKFFQ